MPILDDFRDTQVGLTSPVQGGFDVTPDDVTDLSKVTRGLMVATAGDVAVVLRSGETLTLPGLTPGAIYPVRVSRVLSTGTTATGIKGLV